MSVREAIFGDEVRASGLLHRSLVGMYSSRGRIFCAVEGIFDMQVINYTYRLHHSNLRDQS